MIGRLAVLCAFAAVLSQAQAQETRWPQRPVRLIVPLAPGGSVDMVARLLSSRLTEQFGQQFIVDNRSGGGATIGTAIVALAQPDGHTILMMSGAFASSAALYRLPYDPIKDFAPIARVAAGPLFLTLHPSIHARSLAELLDLARSKPAALNYGSGGTGTTTHLATEYFQQATGIRLTHVPYKGIGAAIGDLLSGQIQMYLAPGGAVLAHVRAGRLHALAQTSEQRLPTMPELPAVAEAVAGFAATFPYAMGAPSGTPQAIVSSLNAAIGRMLEQAQIIERLRSLGLEPAHSTPQALMQAVTREIAIWTKVVKTGGIKVD